MTFALPPTPELIRVKCDVHEWMRAWIWEFEHPYYAVTDADATAAERAGKVTPTMLAITLMCFTLGAWTTDAIGKWPEATPVFVALGITFLLFGVLTSYVFSAAGFLLMVVSISKWVGELLHGE